MRAWARSILPLGAALFFLLTACGGGESPAGPVDPPEADPVTQVVVPGAYGVPGGDQILLPSRQSSLLLHGSSFSYRLLDPATRTVVSFSGLPRQFSASSRVSFLYRLFRDGRVIASEEYENVQILMVRDQMAWLKKDSETFFVIQIP